MDTGMYWSLNNKSNLQSVDFMLKLPCNFFLFITERKLKEARPTLVFKVQLV